MNLSDTEALANHVEQLRAEELGKAGLRLRAVEPPEGLARALRHDGYTEDEAAELIRKRDTARDAAKFDEGRELGLAALRRLAGDLQAREAYLDSLRNNGNPDAATRKHELHVCIAMARATIVELEALVLGAEQSR